MRLFKGRSIEVRKVSSGAYINGKWVDGVASAPVFIQGTVQPVSGYRLQTLVEGKRISAAYDIYTDSDLKASDPYAETKGDQLYIDSYWWDIVVRKPWQNGLISHYEYVVIRVKEGSSASI